jgi:hypothetical protein
VRWAQVHGYSGLIFHPRIVLDNLNTSSGQFELDVNEEFEGISEMLLVGNGNYC